MKGNKLWHLDEFHSDLKPFEIPALSADQILVTGEYSLVSLGTERLVVKGKVPEEIYDDMRIPYMEGNFSFPLTYGYSLVGKIVDGQKKLVGKRVHLLHPHQTHAVCNARDAWIVPDNVPASRAALASNVETALNGIWDSRIIPGESVLIVGAGLIGMLIRSILTGMPLEDCLLCDTDDSMISFAESIGWSANMPGEIEEASYDVAFNCTGSGSGLQTAIEMVGTEGRVIDLSWYGNRSVELVLGGAFHSQRKRIISSQVSQIPGFLQGKWDFNRRKEMVFKLLENSIYDSLINTRVNFRDTPSFYSELRMDEIHETGVLIEYE